METKTDPCSIGCVAGFVHKVKVREDAVPVQQKLGDSPLLCDNQSLMNLTWLTLDSGSQSQAADFLSCLPLPVNTAAVDEPDICTKSSIHGWLHICLCTMPWTQPYTGIIFPDPLQTLCVRRLSNERWVLLHHSCFPVHYCGPLSTRTHQGVVHTKQRLCELVLVASDGQVY